ncbi:MAG: glycosyltransferase family 39 protein [Myxococcota bacterium]
MSVARRRVRAVALYAASVAAAYAFYVVVGRPWIEGAGNETALHWLSRLMGRNLAHRHVLVYADQALWSAGLLSVFVFGVAMNGAKLLSYRTVMWLLLLLGAGIRLHLAIQDPPSIRRWPLNDDSHYYFNIAYNLANGGGLRHDGFNTTTGIQPLFLLLITPVYWVVESKMLAINVILVLQTALGVALGFAISRLARRTVGDSASLFALAVWAFSYYFVGLDLNGLETSLSLLALCVVCLTYLRILDDPGPPNTRRLVCLGTLLGVAFLARTDNGLLGVAVALHYAIADRWAQPFGARLRAVAVVASVAGAFALPWLALNLSMAGSLLPSGGQAVRFLSLVYGFRMMNTTGPAFELANIPWDYYESTVWAALLAVRKSATTAIEVRPALVLAAVALAVGWRAAWKSLRRLGFLFGFLLLLFSAYTAYIFGQWYFYRYLAPFNIAYLLVLASVIWGALTRLAPDPAALSRRVPEIALAGLLAFSLLADAIAVSQPRQRGVRGFYDAALWINRNTPPGAIIGAFQTGIFGYYLERPFYGLDGKVNIDALEALRDSRIDEYVRDKRIEYLADWAFIIEDLFVARARNPDALGRFQKVYSNGDVLIYRVEPESLGQSTTRMFAKEFVAGIL